MFLHLPHGQSWGEVFSCAVAVLQSEAYRYFEDESFEEETHLQTKFDTRWYTNTAVEKSGLFMAMFNSKLLVYQRICSMLRLRGCRSLGAEAFWECPGFGMVAGVVSW